MSQIPPPPPPPGQGRKNKTPNPAEITVLAGAGVVLIFSFLSFYEVSLGGFSDSTNAWGTGLFPLATLIVLFAVVAGLLVGLELLGRRRPRSHRDVLAHPAAAGVRRVRDAAVARVPHRRPQRRGPRHRLLVHAARLGGRARRGDHDLPRGPEHLTAGRATARSGAGPEPGERLRPAGCGRPRRRRARRSRPRSTVGDERRRRAGAVRRRRAPTRRPPTTRAAGTASTNSALRSSAATRWPFSS